MIPKKYFITQEPVNYPTISMTSCLGKLLERLVYSRLYIQLLVVVQRMFHLLHITERVLVGPD
ncbi:hypothetical protein BpHYR1_016800 [Brachionus plicatilis]|uniref:Uncharacterized protein n=1 Tax=Brachionus plicatilis TaxID=10195 RepID=A0A3M7RLP1_BRAPC|nr:hypothetical protein BpHYR1_016800 [Brachionus plicatilis]